MRPRDQLPGRPEEGLANRDSGFTLIELLVVIIIIGILAAIAIPVFMKQRQGAYDSAAKSDLHTLAQFQEARLAGGVEYGSFAELALDELPMRPTQKRHADHHQARVVRLLPERASTPARRTRGSGTASPAASSRSAPRRAR